MAKFELSIHEDYLAGRWGIYEGIREIVQNALDAQDDYPSCPMVVDHGGGYLRIRSEGAVLGQEVLLLGKTSKDGRSDQRGQFGEGLKLGLLALIRQGIDVYIMNGDVKWTPYVARSENFGGERVLWISVRKMQKRTEDFTVYLKISKAQWKELQNRFLDMSENDLDKIDYSKGSILLDAEERGNVYVKGIFVKRYEHLSYGYNFTYGVTLDRDRGMVDEWDLKSSCADAWKEILRGDGNVDENVDTAEWMNKAYESLKSDESKDLEYLGSGMKYDSASSPLKQGFADQFSEEHGKDAVPVSCEDEARKVEFYGKKGVVVPQALHSVLESTFGSMDAILRDASESSGKVVPVASLGAKSGRSYKGALRLLFLANCGSLEDLEKQIEVYDFQDEGRLGTYDPNVEIKDELKRIRVSPKCLGSISSALRVMIHEKAHEMGSDGSMDHRATMEKIWSEVTDNLLEMAGSGWLFE